MTGRQIATEEMVVRAPQDRVARWVLEPEKVLLYAPDPISGGVFEPGEKVWIRLKTGVTLLERVAGPSRTSPLTVRVTASSLKTDPSTPGDVLAQRLMTFYEDWFITAHPRGTQIKKVWRDLKKHRLRLMPFGFFIRSAARRDAPRLETAWADIGD